MTKLPFSTVAVLDHIDQITVPADRFDEPSDEYQTLLCLLHGMEFLYQQASRCERRGSDTTDDKSAPGTTAPGTTAPGIAGPPISQTLLACMFSWYATSAYQYARIIGAIARRQDASRPLPRAYARGVMPEIVAFCEATQWLGAAHGGLPQTHTDPERDGIVAWELIEQDGMHQIQAVLPDALHPPHRETFGTWSLCRTHETLRNRYWPKQWTDAGL